jgi:hypothetical protein
MPLPCVPLSTGLGTLQQMWPDSSCALQLQIHALMIPVLHPHVPEPSWQQPAQLAPGAVYQLRMLTHVDTC